MRVNSFLLEDQNIMNALNRQFIYEIIYSDGASPSLDKAAALVKAKTSAPRLIFNVHQ